jgi:hypothetical protein
MREVPKTIIHHREKGKCAMRSIRSIAISLLFSVLLHTTALADDYFVVIDVDGKSVSMLVSTDESELRVVPDSPMVSVVSISRQDAVRLPTANKNANLRGGPGTNFPVIGSVATGQELIVTGRNQSGDWLQLADGKWIAAFLVNSMPKEVPVTQPATVPPTTTPEPLPQPTAKPVSPPTPTARACDASYPDFCLAPGIADLDCGEISHRNFAVLPPDPHGFDRDNDGIGCEGG